jgi:hypothetical protein
VDIITEKEDFDLENLQMLKDRLKQQKLHDQLQYKVVAPKIQNMGKSLEILKQA